MLVALYADAAAPLSDDGAGAIHAAVSALLGAGADATAADLAGQVPLAVAIRNLGSAFGTREGNRMGASRHQLATLQTLLASGAAAGTSAEAAGAGAFKALLLATGMGTWAKAMRAWTRVELALAHSAYREKEGFVYNPPAGSQAALDVLLLLLQGGLPCPPALSAALGRAATRAEDGAMMLAECHRYMEKSMAAARAAGGLGAWRRTPTAQELASQGYLPLAWAAGKQPIVSRATTVLAHRAYAHLRWDKASSLRWEPPWGAQDELRRGRLAQSLAALRLAAAVLRQAATAVDAVASGAAAADLWPWLQPGPWGAEQLQAEVRRTPVGGVARLAGTIAALEAVARAGPEVGPCGGRIATLAAHGEGLDFHARCSLLLSAPGVFPGLGPATACAAPDGAASSLGAALLAVADAWCSQGVAAELVGARLRDVVEEAPAEALLVRFAGSEGLLSVSAEAARCVCTCARALHVPGVSVPAPAPLVC